MSAEDGLDVVKQTDSFCLLYAVINSLPNNEARRKFLMGTDQDTLNIDKFIEHLRTHKHFENSDESDAFYFGMTAMHIVFWLKHLKRNNIVSSFIYHKLGNNLDDRFNILKKIIDGHQVNRGRAFIITGLATTHEVHLKKLKDRLKRKKRELNGDEPMHPVDILLRNDNFKPNRYSEKVSKGDKSCHAICLKVDKQGLCWLYDPGKIRVKPLSRDPKLFVAFIHSLFDIYLIHRIDIRFK